MKKTKQKQPKRIKADIHTGLDDQTVRTRKLEGYDNSFKDKNTKSIPRILFDNFFNSFNIVLLSIAAAFLFFVIYLNSHGYKDIADRYFGFSKFTFLIPMLLNSGIGSYQEIHSRHVLKKLKIVNTSKATVIREAKECTISSQDVVLDDILVWKAGNQACCDSIILEGEVEVDESLLTGESDYVKKRKGDTIFSGSSIMTGSCHARAEKVGDDTYSCQLSKQVKQLSRHKSELMTNIYGIIKIMAVVLIFVCLIVVGTLVYKVNKWGNDTSVWPDNMTHSLSSMVTWSKIVLTMGAFAIGIIPTGLVLMTSVTLAVSITSLAKKKTMIQELFSLENLSRVNTICLDKTGTLTDGSMKVESLLSYIPKDDVIRHLEEFNFASTDDNQTSMAIKGAYRKKEVAFQSFIPFSSKTKTSSLVYMDGGRLTLGAPDYLIGKDEKAYLDFQRPASEGRRVLALSFNDKTIALLLLKDNIRPSASDTIDFFYDNNVDCKIISGDNLLTLTKIAKECHVRNADKGISMENVSLEEIPSLAHEYTLFARTTPEQKKAIVEALQASGKKVAMTGDGVNDILALRKANASITFAKATQAAKSVCDVVLLDNDFSHLKDVVRQGRRVVNNIERTASLFLMKTIAIALLSILLIPFKRGQMWFGVENLYLMQTSIIALAGFLLSLESTKKPIEGSFRKNVFPRAILSGTFMVLAVLVPILLNQIPKAFQRPVIIDDGNVSTMISLLAFASGFIVLISMSIPFTNYRKLVILLSLISAILLSMMSPTSYIGGKASTFSMFHSPDGNFLHSEFMNQFFRPWNADCVKEFITQKSCLITMAIYFILALPGYCFFMKGILSTSKKSILLKGIGD